MAQSEELSFIRHPDFRSFYAIGAIGTWTDNDFRINFYSEKVKEHEGDSLVNDVQVILPPKAVRELAVALTRSIKEYERSTGVSLKAGKSQKDSETRIMIDSQPVESPAGLSQKGVSDKLLGPNFKKDLTKDIRQDLKKDIKQDIERGLKQDIKKDLTKDLKQDITKDLKKGLKQDMKKDIRSEVRGVIKGSKQKDKRDKGVKSKSTAVQQRGRRRVGRGRKAIKK